MLVSTWNLEGSEDPGHGLVMNSKPSGHESQYKYTPGYGPAHVMGMFVRVCMGVCEIDGQVMGPPINIRSS